MREVLSIYWRFFRLGLMAFGGPFPQIAMLQRELVEREKWTTHSRFNRVLALYQALPGPEATEMCVWLGSCRAGKPGALAAGLGFLTPGTLFTLAAAWLYLQVGATGGVRAALAGAQVGALALLVVAAVRLTRSAAVDSTMVFVCIAAAGSSLAGMHFAPVLMMGAAAGYLTDRGKNWLGFGLIGAFVLFSALIAVWLALSSASEDAPAIGTGAAAGTASPLYAGLSALKAGGLSFGGAYTAVPFLRDDAVRLHDWMTHAQFLDGLAVVGALPAPLVSVAGFVGLIAGGWGIALLMLALVYVPAFAFTLLGHARLERWLEHEPLHAALDGAAAAVAGMVCAAAVQLAGPLLSGAGPVWMVKVPLLVVAVAAALVLKQRWINAAVVACAAAVGALLPV